VKGAGLLASPLSVFGAPPRLNNEGLEESLFAGSEDLKENFGGSEEPFEGLNENLGGSEDDVGANENFFAFSGSLGLNENLGGSSSLFSVFLSSVFS